MPEFAQRLFAADLAKDPNDFFAAAAPGSYPSSYALDLSTLGNLHIGIVVALLAAFSWDYPGPNAMLAAFILISLSSVSTWAGRNGSSSAPSTSLSST